MEKVLEILKPGTNERGLAGTTLTRFNQKGLAVAELRMKKSCGAILSYSFPEGHAEGLFESINTDRAFGLRCVNTLFNNNHLKKGTKFS